MKLVKDALLLTAEEATKTRDAASAATFGAGLAKDEANKAADTAKEPAKAKWKLALIRAATASNADFRNFDFD